MTESLPLLPLVLAEAPEALVRALAQEGIPTVRAEHDPRGGRFVLVDRRRRNPSLLPGQTEIDVGALIAEYDEDPYHALDDARTARAAWQIGDLAVSEVVSRVDKAALRASLMRALRQRVESAGGVWLRVGPFPFPYRSAFHLRLDHDRYVPHDFHALLDALAQHGDACSHFVCGGGFVESGRALERLRGLHVGSHGFHHHTYRDQTVNARNIARGIDFLHAQGLNPVGFVAPHGRYPHGMGETLSRLGIPFSSEFGLIDDDLPMQPRGSAVWQAPVHPVCLGICLEAARAAGVANAPLRAVATFSDYAVAWALARYAAGLPMFLYGHPDDRLGRWPQVIRDLLATVDALARVWRVTMLEFIRWWQARERVRLRVVERGAGYTVQVLERPPEFRLAVEWLHEERVATVELASATTCLRAEDVSFERRGSGVVVPRRRVDDRRNWRDRFKHWIDWEKATPVDELDESHWRGWTKRALRRWCA